MEYTDTQLIEWLAAQAYLPEDQPVGEGVYAVVSEKFAPIGSFTGNVEKDATAFRKAICMAIMES